MNHHRTMAFRRYHSKDLRKNRHSEDGRIYLVTTTSYSRQAIFRNIALGTIVANEIRNSDDGEKTRTFSYVVMPDHLHWLFSLQPYSSLSAVVRSVKGRAAIRINKSSQRTGAVWQPGFHDRALRDEESLESVGNYIIANPLRAGLVSHADDYPLWDLMWQRWQARIRG